MLLYKDARRIARAAGVHSLREWYAFVRQFNAKLPARLPAKPGEKMLANRLPPLTNVYYASQWRGWGDFLGVKDRRLGYVKKVRPFVQARKFVRSLAMTSGNAWRKYARSSQCPRDLPIHPERTYAAWWQGWGNFLGASHQPWGGRPSRFGRVGRTIIIIPGLVHRMPVESRTRGVPRNFRHSLTPNA